MNDVSAQTEASNKKQTSDASLFEWSRMAMPFVFHGFAEQGVRRVKESSERMQAVSEEMTGALRESYLTTAKGAADYGLKVVQIANANANSALDFVSDLMTTRSMPEILNLSTAMARKNLETASAQNLELWEIARRVATETAEPIKLRVGKVLSKA